MTERPLSINSFSRAIIHIDGDAFFASCEQSRDPQLKGCPVITGKERGIVASLSYEAKACGVKRGMMLGEVKRVCPEVVMLPSDYETYGLLSRRFFQIVRRYTPSVEEYSIDECFADVTGLRRPLRCSYPQIAAKIKHELDNELGFTFSVGLGPNKTVAKIASKWKKPSGLTVIPGYLIHQFLQSLWTEDIWGIGSQTSSHLKKLGIDSALDFARQEEAWVRSHFTKPIIETWQELNGKYIISLETESKRERFSVQKVKTFTPPSSDRDFIFSQLSKNIENACIRLRRYKLAARRGVFFLKKQNFRYQGIELRLSLPTAIPSELVDFVREKFDQVYQEGELYRATGVMLSHLQEPQAVQLDLFGQALQSQEWKKVFQGVDRLNSKFGKHTVFLGSSFLANHYSQHISDRGDEPSRKKLLLKGETKRRRLAIPMLRVGEI